MASQILGSHSNAQPHPPPTDTEFLSFRIPCEMVQPLWKNSLAVPPNVIIYNYLGPATPLLGMYLKELKAGVQTKA